MPSVAFALWMMVAAGGPTEPLAPPPHGRDVTAPTAPSTPKPALPREAMPAEARSPRAPAGPAAASPPLPAAAKPARAAEPTRMIQEPEEEVVSDANGKMKLRTIGTRPTRKAASVERGEIPERKNPWSADRYSAVVPPGLTLAALRSQLNKGAITTPESAAPAERNQQSQVLAEIEKAREALRQETARLEALLKTTGACGGGGGVGMPVGDNVMATPVSTATINEAPAEQIESVSKAMKGMKPEQAAAVVARLDRALAAEILRRMKAADAGAILGMLKPEMAADLTTEMAIRKASTAKDRKGGAK